MITAPPPAIASVNATGKPATAERKAKTGRGARIGKGSMVEPPLGNMGSEIVERRDEDIEPLFRGKVPDHDNHPFIVHIGEGMRTARRLGAPRYWAGNVEWVRRTVPFNPWHRSHGAIGVSGGSAFKNLDLGARPYEPFLWCRTEGDSVERSNLLKNSITIGLMPLE